MVSDVRRLAAIWLWYGFGVVYLFLLVATLWGAVVFPLLLSVVMIPVALVFAALHASRSRRTVLIVLNIALLELLIGIVLLSDPDFTWHVRGSWRRGMIRLPEPIGVLLWLLGVLMPAALTYWVLRQLKASDSARSLG
jgi:hypothetical protein